MFILTSISILNNHSVLLREIILRLYIYNNNLKYIITDVMWWYNEVCWLKKHKSESRVTLELWPRTCKISRLISWSKDKRQKTLMNLCQYDGCLSSLSCVRMRFLEKLVIIRRNDSIMKNGKRHFTDYGLQEYCGSLNNKKVLEWCTKTVLLNDTILFGHV